MNPGFGSFTGFGSEGRAAIRERTPAVGEREERQLERAEWQLGEGEQRAVVGGEGAVILRECGWGRSRGAAGEGIVLRQIVACCVAAEAARW